MRHCFWICVAVILLAGCESNGIYVPVGAADETPSPVRRIIYVVHRGDTLYSIASRHGLDYRHLAAINNIHPPYTIHIGERLRLGSGQPSIAARNETSADSAQAADASRGIAAPDVADDNIDWRWPYKGMVVNGFSSTGKVNDGIDILGKPGAKIHATAPGVVVYAGGGLRGYGKLVIVRHNKRFLSAYGRNAKIYVKEGEKVSAGQVISSLGKANGADELLHFEIRRNGKPQNPLKYLPRRQHSHS